MAKTYNTIPSVSTGDVYTASAHNNIVTNVNNYRVPPAASVFITADVSPYTNNAAMAWTSTAYDTDGMYSAGATDRLTVQTPGLYYINANGSINGTGLTQAFLYINVNGTNKYAGTFGITSTSAKMNISAVISLVATDYVRILVGHAGSASVAASGVSDNENRFRFSMTWLGQVS